MKNQTRTVILCMGRWFKCLFLLMLLIWLSGCGQPKDPSKPVDTSHPPVVNHFDEFYQSFNTDTNFQRTHIRFPLEGEPEQGDTMVYSDTYYWHLSHWVWHKTFNEKDTLFTRHFEVIDSSWVKEVIVHNLSPMRLERRYSFDGSDWTLIYYSPLRIPVKIEIN